MTNKRNTEMAKNAAVLGLFGLLVIIIIGIALAVYFGTQKTQATDELPEDLGPQIKVDSLSAKYNPSPEEHQFYTRVLFHLWGITPCNFVV